MTKRIAPASPKGVSLDGGDRRTLCTYHPAYALSLSARRRALIVMVLLGVVAWLLSDGAAWSAPRDQQRPIPPRPAKLLWEDRFGQPGKNEFPAANGIAASDGVVFVVGTAQSASGDANFLVRAYSADNGRLLWEDVFDRAGGNDEANGITLAGGRVFALGGANLANFRGIPLIRAYDSMTGRLL